MQTRKKHIPALLLNNYYTLRTVHIHKLVLM